MGWAKYSEDNMDIFNRRMYEKDLDFPDKRLEDFKKKLRYENSLMEKEEEYKLILEELKRIDEWINIIDNLYGFAGSESFINLLKKQYSSLNKSKDEFINYQYDPKFKIYRAKEYDTNEIFLGKFKKQLNKNYLDFFLEKIKNIDNKNNNLSIELNRINWDLKIFLTQYYFIEVESIDKPLIQYVREDILKEGKIKMVSCNHCKNNTYKDYKSCIVCKYPNEVK